MSYLFKNMFIDFKERGRERETERQRDRERERSINVRKEHQLVASYVPCLGTESITFELNPQPFGI